MAETEWKVRALSAEAQLARAGEAVTVGWNFMQSPESYSDSERRFAFEKLDRARDAFRSFSADATPNEPPSEARSERIKAPLPKWITDRYGDTPEVRESLEQFASTLTAPDSSASQSGERDDG